MGFYVHKQQKFMPNVSQMFKALSEQFYFIWVLVFRFSFLLSLSMVLTAVQILSNFVYLLLTNFDLYTIKLSLDVHFRFN